MTTTGLNNLEITRGAAKVHRVTIDNPPPAGVGVWTFRLYVYPDGVTTDPLVSKATGITASAPATAVITWESTDTSGILPGCYPYVLLGSSDNLVCSFGSLRVRPGVPAV